VVLLFQPAEETGEGAERVIADSRFARIRPDWIFALHNLPGHPLGRVLLRPGVFACASTGLAIRLTGTTSHAAHPEQARCPALPMAEIIKGLIALPERFDFFTLVTVVHARLGEVAFGTTPGEAEVMATLRAAGDEQMQALLAAAGQLAEAHAAAQNLALSCACRDPFTALVNDPDAVGLIRSATLETGGEAREMPAPFRWSDDFGRFTALAKGAMFGLGAGQRRDPLHSPTYDFPDDLIPAGVRIFEHVLRTLCGPA
jgi:metal-dependent amidase/aminoacylase/carboxypeptidase family protein